MPFFNIFIKDIPSRIDLQKALDHNQIPIGLLKSYELVEYRGWARMKLGSYNGAIEIFVDYVTSQYIPVGREQIGDRGIVITLNYGDDAMSSCLAAGLASTMAKSFDALVYAGQFLSSKQLLITFNELLTRARFEARQTPHKLLLDALSARLPHFAKKGNYFFYLPLGHSVRGFFLAPSKGTYEFKKMTPIDPQTKVEIRTTDEGYKMIHLTTSQGLYVFKTDSAEDAESWLNKINESKNFVTPGKSSQFFLARNLRIFFLRKAPLVENSERFNARES